MRSQNAVRSFDLSSRSALFLIAIKEIVHSQNKSSPRRIGAHAWTLHTC